MRVGIDYRAGLYGRGGIAVYVRELVAAYARAFPEDRVEAFAHQARRPHRPWPDPVLPPNARLHRSRLPWQAQRVLAAVGVGPDRLLGGVDVFHGVDYVVMPRLRAPFVATIHDLLFDEMPEAYTLAMRRGLRWTTGEILRRARRVIVPSERTRRSLLARHAIAEDAIDVVPHGVRALPPTEPASIGTPYVLFVGTLEPRKNVARLLAAFSLVRPRAGNVRLVVAGPRGWMDDEVVAEIARREDVRWEPRPDAERLSALYRGALALAYPSLGEGFGLPVLEAMSVGKPVLVGAETACSDLAGDGGLAIDPRDVDAIAEALGRLATDAALCERLGRAGEARARAFTWDRAARATRETYIRAVR